MTAWAPSCLIASAFVIDDVVIIGLNPESLASWIAGAAKFQISQIIDLGSIELTSLANSATTAQDDKGCIFIFPFPNAQRDFETTANRRRVVQSRDYGQQDNREGRSIVV